MANQFQLISAEDALDNNGISFGLIVWEDSDGDFFAKASRGGTRLDTPTFPTIDEAISAARDLATTMPGQ